MVDYFIFGRFPGGFTHLKNQAPGSLNGSYCGNMVKYDLPKTSSEEQIDYASLPEKMFYLNANVITDQGRVERYAVTGKTFPHTLKTSPMSGERETTFSFQYLLTGQERELLLKEPERIFKLREFASRIDDLYLGDEAAQDQKFPFAFDMTRTDIWDETDLTADPEEVLAYFGLNNDKLRQLVAGLFLVKRKVFIALPEIDKNATDQAKKLALCILKALPESIAETTGFLTYVKSIKKDYIPAETRIVFFADTEENRRTASEASFASTGFVLARDYASGFFIPEGLEPIAEEVRECLLSQAPSEKLSAYYDLLNKVRGFSTNASILPGDYVCAWNYSAARMQVERGEVPDADEQQIWDAIHGLQKHPEVWDKENMQNELTDFLRSYISSETISEKTYEELFRAYHDFNAIREDISGFLARSITDKQVLRRHMKYLEKDPTLREEVAALVYNDESKSGFVAEYESEEMKDDLKALSIAQDGADLNDSVQAVLNRLGMVKERHALLAVHPVLQKTVRQSLEKLFLEDPARDLETDRAAWITFASGQAKLFLPDTTYQKVCCEVFGKYLDRFQKLLSMQYRQPEELDSWPQILYMRGSGNEKKMAKLRAVLTEKSAKDSYIAQIKNVIAGTDDIRVLTRFLKTDENRPVLAALKSDEGICRQAVGAMLRKGYDYDRAKVKTADKSADFDELHIQLYEKFPEYADNIFYAVMKASLGGLPSMAEIAHRLQADGVNPRVIRAQMQEAVKRYYNNNRPGWSEKRQMKDCRAFLEKLALTPEQLM